MTFAIEGPLIYISTLDMGRLWERLMRRARIPLAYTQGFNPHPKLQMASALPVGYSSECELLDVFLAESMGPLEFAQKARLTSPIGLSITHVEEVPIKAIYPQSGMREATYRVGIWTPGEPAEVETAIKYFLSRESIIRQRFKKGRMVDYDLRPLVLGIEYRCSNSDYHELEMSVKCGSHGAGRPEQVLDELGLAISRYTIHRIDLIWDKGRNDP